MKVRVEYFIKGNGKGRAFRTVILGDAITPQVEFIFGNGQCHALALALHDILSWQILGEWNGYDGHRGNRHFVLQSPSKPWCTADIHGIRCLDCNKRKVSAVQLRRKVPEGFLQPCRELAEHFAPIVAAALREQEEAMAKGSAKPAWTICSEGYL